MRFMGGLARVTETTAGGSVKTFRLSSGRGRPVVSRCWAAARSDHRAQSTVSAATRPRVTSCAIPSNPWLSEQERGFNRSAGARQGTSELVLGQGLQCVAACEQQRDAPALVDGLHDVDLIFIQVEKK